jgi:DNA-binding NarL/FixJ family response regulator
MLMSHRAPGSGCSCACRAASPERSHDCVLIADDQHLVRTGLKVILDRELDIEVIAEATNGREAVSIARELRPDVAIMDIRMPDLDGIEATRRITAQSHEPRTRVSMLTTFDLDEYVFDALRGGERLPAQRRSGPPARRQRADDRGRGRASRTHRHTPPD